MESADEAVGELAARRGGKHEARAWPSRVSRVARALPAARWAARYGPAAAAADAVAGVTLGLTLVPQSIAYAALAGLPVHYGLYSAFVGTFVYAVLGTVKEVSIGPTSLMALLTLQTCKGLPVQYMVLLTFLAGCVVLVMGLLRLGFLVDLISPSVTSGFTSATAIIIVVSQIKGLLGLSFTAESVFENVSLIYEKRSEVRLPDCALSAVCCIVLLSLRKLKDVPVGPKRRVLKKALWLVSISRNALVVCGASLVAFHTTTDHGPLFKLSGRVKPGLPPFQPPPFSVPAGNGTAAVGFLDMVHELSSGVVILPIVMVLANIAIAKAFTSGGRFDARQEMITLGLCNVAGAFFQAMPTCGAFTRSAVSHASGVRSPAAGLYSGIITLLALNYMTQYFYFIPKACLSSVLICAVIFMVDVARVRTLWGQAQAQAQAQARGELAVLGATFAVGVASSAELAVLAGALAALAAALRRALRPPLRLTQWAGASGALVARPSLALLYLNAEHVSWRLQRAARRGASARLLLDCGQLALVDYTAGQMLEELASKLSSARCELVVFNASADVLPALQRLRCTDPRVLRAASPEDALAAAPGPAPAPAPAPAPPPPAPAARPAAAPLLGAGGERR